MQATPPPQAGLIIVTEGYTIAFWTLGAVAAVGLVLYARFMPETKQTISDAV
jgi:hypothetical protein